MNLTLDVRLGLFGKILCFVFNKNEPQKHKMLMSNVPICGMLLDGGCGAGDTDHSCGLHSKAKRVIGLDVFSKDVKTYVGRFGCEGIVASLDYLPFKPNVFDVAVLQDSLEHTANPIGVLSQLRVMVKKKLLVFVPNWYNLFFDFNPYTHDLHTQFNGSWSWNRMVKASGFKNCFVSSVSFPFFSSAFLSKYLHYFGIGVFIVAS